MANKLWGSLESQDSALVPVPPAISLMPSPYERPGTASERWRLAPVPAALPYGDLPTGGSKAISYVTWALSQKVQNKL